MQHDLDLRTGRSGQGWRGCSQWVPCGDRGVKADHLVPSHKRAAASALARSSGLHCDIASSSAGSPLPAVLATICHLKPSILSIGAPSPLISTQARRFCAIGLFCLAALRSSATAAASFFGVPVPLKSALAYSLSASTLPASGAAG